MHVNGTEPYISVWSVVSSLCPCTLTLS